MSGVETAGVNAEAESGEGDVTEKITLKVEGSKQVLKDAERPVT